MTTPIGATNQPPATIATPPPTQGTSPSAAADQSQLSSSQFLQLLVAQLRYQDPTSPVDNAALMQQTATLNQITTMQQLAQASTNQMQAEQQQTAANMVGRSVSYLDNTGASHNGYVSAATISGTNPSLTVGGQTVALAQVQQVFATTPTTPTS